MAPALLALEDGSVYVGQAAGAVATRTGEVVFNTAMTGYQEVLTDPSYLGQIVVMTSPQIGNYGVVAEDNESVRSEVEGFVVRELSRVRSNWRSQKTLSEFLTEQGIPALTGVDTRALVRRLRLHGALRGTLSTEGLEAADLVARARSWPGLVGRDLVRKVTPCGNWQTGPTAAHPASATEQDRAAGPVVVIDCGVKWNILRQVARRGHQVVVVSASASADEILARRPTGVLVGNGPGDPEPLAGVIATLRDLLGRVPVFGICLGHQLLALALGASTYKLKFGHHGTNHPVRCLRSGRVSITSQNHGFAVDAQSLQAVGGIPTHVNLNDWTLEGFVHPQYKLMTVQYHPEAHPGPHDADDLFDAFTRLMAQADKPAGRHRRTALPISERSA